MPFTSDTAKQAGKMSSRKEKPNKTTKELKTILQRVVEVQLDTIEEDLQDLAPKDRLNILLKLVEYVLPKQREQKIDFSNLSDAEIDELINKITDESSRKN
jgi:hypothetical protein